MKQKRKVAYVRVSTASDAQIHSYEFQEQYWRKKLSEDKDGEFCGIYADKGISGCSIKKRPQFLAMMADAREHKFDEINTKSVSRFARNTVELLETVRELRDLGIEVIFEKENIHTFNPTSEVFLTIAATIAENDLKVDSDRQRWSIKHRIENGWISIGSGMFGYKMTKDNELEIVPQEAEIVRKIFEWYLAGEGTQTIAQKLNEASVTTAKGYAWTPQKVMNIISNEKYMGDCIMGKSVYVDGAKRDNGDGQYGPRYYLENTHEGIISKETWQAAQEQRASRKNEKLVGMIQPTHPFSRIIECSQCGAHYQHKINNSGTKWSSDIWACATKLHHGASRCDCTTIKDSVLREKFIEAYNEFITDRPKGAGIQALESMLEKLRKEEAELAALNFNHLISKAAYDEERRENRQKQTALLERIQEQKSKGVHESDFTPITEFDEEKVDRFITRIVMSEGVVTFEFYNGVKISKKYTNGQPGNKPGWNKKEV